MTTDWHYHSLHWTPFPLRDLSVNHIAVHHEDREGRETYRERHTSFYCSSSRPCFSPPQFSPVWSSNHIYRSGIPMHCPYSDTRWQPSNAQSPSNPCPQHCTLTQICCTFLKSPHPNQQWSAENTVLLQGMFGRLLNAKYIRLIIMSWLSKERAVYTRQPPGGIGSTRLPQTENGFILSPPFPHH